MTSYHDAVGHLAETFHTRVRRLDGVPAAETRFRRGSLRFTVLGDPVRVLIEVRGFRQAPMKFSLNHSDEFRRDATPVDTVGAITVLAYSQLHNLELLRPWLGNPYHRALIGALSLRPEEYAHIYQNGIDVAVLPESAVPDLVMRLEAIVAALPAGERESVLEGIVEMPSSLQALGPLFAEWSIADDEERGRKFSHASQRRLRKLRDTVEPLMLEINTYLDSFGGKPLTPAAMQLADLAQGNAELRAREA